MKLGKWWVACMVCWCMAGGMQAQETHKAAPTVTAKRLVPDNPLHPEAPLQPLPYSHKTHIALGLHCASCHTNPESGSLMTFPATATCMACHVTIAKDKPSIQELSAFARSGETVPWVRVYKVLEGVRWTHAPHLKAGVRCQVCHGEIAQMEATREATSVTTMAVCLTCHEEKKAKTTCNTCHLWPRECRGRD